MKIAADSVFDIHNRIYQCDCLEGMRSLPDSSVDMILTDPPYYLHNVKDTYLKKSNLHLVKSFEFDVFKDEETYLNFMREVAEELYRVCKEGSAGYLFCSEQYLSFIRKILNDIGFKIRGTVYWHKTNPFPSFHNRKSYTSSVESCLYFSKGKVRHWTIKPANERLNLFSLPKAGGYEKTPHRTQKPLSLCRKLIEMSSQEHDLIIDPFMGSGSTAIAALDLKRRFIGYEHNPTYCGYIRDRLKKWLLQNTFNEVKKPMVIFSNKI